MHKGKGIKKRNLEVRGWLEFCDKKAVLGKHMVSKGERKISHNADGCGTEISFVLVGKKDKSMLRKVHAKVIPWIIQHRLMVMDLEKMI